MGQIARVGHSEITSPSFRVSFGDFRATELNVMSIPIKTKLIYYQSCIATGEFISTPVIGWGVKTICHLDANWGVS